ncbi:hypothetical protein D1831_05860 [Lactiplantibacillus garii]|uniref:Integral membrane protein n=1 Tax=Lactiplantibacillus garii TaxID=2306423 RepID=A0A426D7X6_9LACO|nr:hypothetical protein [Lactiplantibacillus garii]RRK10702.1 hypothetical protein D1831_05860 [Lactiplantibacillus garii]
MRFSKRYHLFEWLINLLLVIGPVILIGLGLLGTGGWIEMVLGTAFMIPISLGCTIFYGWLYFQPTPHHLAGYQWGLLAFYLLGLVGSLIMTTFAWNLS